LSEVNPVSGIRAFVGGGVDPGNHGELSRRFYPDAVETPYLVYRLTVGIREQAITLRPPA
jgi:hypothetical protein